MGKTGDRGVRLYIKSFVSDAAMQRLYALRQEGRRSDGVRTRVATLLCLAMAVLSIALLVSTSWVPSDVNSYIASRSSIFHVEDQSLSWAAGEFTYGTCGKSQLDCYRLLRGQPLTAQPLAAIDSLINERGESARILVRLKVSVPVLERLPDEKIVVVALPSFNFNQAALYRNGTPVGTFFRGQKLVSILEAETFEKGALLEFDAVMEVLSSDRTLSGTRNQEGVLVASQGEYERYRDFVGAKRMNAAGQMGQVAKIVLALFCLLLFLIVDSSPESLGMALFMGFEAAAMGVGSGYLPLGFFGIEKTTVFTQFCYQMGDILKLYFLFQMARVGPTSVKPWLLWGTVASIPYAFFRQYAAENDILWAYKMSLGRDSVVGTIGGLVCLRSFWLLRKQSLPWRKTALIIAAVAAFFEVINSFLAHSNGIRIMPQLQTLYTVFQANCGYLFALSTFLNISTLENRVKALTAAKARAEQIERELEIGQIVQQALLKPPALPDSVEIACHHEAALYVSGDTYYAHWDERRGVVAFMVNDVTGHGVQAALKASACNVLAKTIWENEKAKDMECDGARFVEYDRLTQKLLVEMNAVPDFNSLVGAEFSIRTGDLAVYRSNFTFPVLISPRVDLDETYEPSLGALWEPELIAGQNQTIVAKKIRRGSFVLFISDGFMESSRDYKAFTEYLRRQLASRDANATVETITDMVIRYEGFNRRIIDDRTLLVFQWTNKAIQKKTQMDFDLPVLRRA